MEMGLKEQDNFKNRTHQYLKHESEKNEKGDKEEGVII